MQRAQPIARRPMVVSPAPARAAFARDVRIGLAGAPRWLPPRWFYDDVGSALFEAITYLPEYGLTAAEQRIFDRHAVAIADRVRALALWRDDAGDGRRARRTAGAAGDRLRVVELGAGTGRKTRCLVSALAAHAPVTYRPVDVSAVALAQCARNLEGVTGAAVAPIEAEYLPGLAAALADRGDAPALVLFLGSTIGNFDLDERDEFLAGVRATLRPGDAFLLATDLVKPAATLIAAYDDSAGVTAAFNKNLIARINRELGGDFDLPAFRHLARWNDDARRIEMHLVATRAVRAMVPAAGITVSMEPDETIWTESSHKYDLGELPILGARAGFDVAGQWIDVAWPFAETLFGAAG